MSDAGSIPADTTYHRSITWPGPSVPDVNKNTLYKKVNSRINDPTWLSCDEINNFVYLITVSVPSFSALFHPDPVTSCCKGPAAEVKNKLYN